MQITPLVFGDLVAPLPIVQGGMGVGISLSGLAGAVAKEGGVGVISGVEIGFCWPGYQRNKAKANFEALSWHIRRAKEIAPAGIIGVNLMVDLSNYDEMV
ncbi:MAG: nitronate monooxygenase, partial [bacterium]|nr:nitronate monooxygenase [bacterium]